MSRHRRKDPGNDRPLGPLESAVMNVLWETPGPLTVRQMVDAMADRDLAYTTVMTVLDNLHRKGWAERDLAGRAYRYRPKASREEHVGQLMAEALSSAADQHAALARFVDTMTSEEAAALRELLDERGKPSA
ncbi:MULTISPECIES: BlaI/MecI/CopY family transcriptional regulator [unclassified Micromonospora]|uniref:BlaI/MecI/CopY family transcriptional regulator n=1 Tax=unclassified Micromonospora TaxID=2617518 RepID=UPI001C21C4C2|nr:MULTISPECIES: BlaI/MecI/CopY family transcriptional regulator [unclassified Micromonospora]MBU8860231.1 BlaI/MecI/CopY family transcriptional regulator [Micromonospora sp. WMMB482]MDM4779764.1 BlaI/MecI/CopY family transcriptional regulator [Micromonospora sp. b486]